MSYRGEQDGEPGHGGNGVLGFALVIALTAAAFLAAHHGLFGPEQRATIFASARDVEQVETAEAAEPDEITLPISPAAKPVAQSCNVDVCAQAYKSFRSSDCSFQPYEGPRRLCER